MSRFAIACEVVEAIRSRRISASEVLDARLAHIGRHNLALMAVVNLDEAGARRRAREAAN